MAKLSHCCKAGTRLSTQEERVNSGCYADIICTACGRFCEEWKEKRDLKKEFEQKFTGTSPFHFTPVVYGNPYQLWQWITDNFNPRQ